MNSLNVVKQINMDQTLENLENDFWGKPPHGASSVVTKCYNLRQKKLKDFEIEDLRLLISQQIGLSFLVPLAIKTLYTNAFIEADYYEGDLLKSVLNSKADFWKENPKLKEDIIEIFRKNENIMQEIVLSQEIKDELIRAYNNILKI